jgi:hypothetical protein
VKRTLLIAVAGLSLGVGAVALADRVHDWHNLDKAHNHVRAVFITSIRPVSASCGVGSTNSGTTRWMRSRTTSWQVISRPG